MNRIKETISNALYYHISLLVIMMVVLGSIGAGIVIALFALRAPVPDQSIQIPSGEQVRVAKGVLDHISSYADQKAADAKIIPSVASSVFYVPPKAQ